MDSPKTPPTDAQFRAAIDTVVKYLEALKPEAGHDREVGALTIAQAAARLSISKSGVRRLILNGSLRAIRVTPRRVCVRSDDVEALLGPRRP